MLITYLMLGQDVWKMHKSQKIWEDDACLAGEVSEWRRAVTGLAARPGSPGNHEEMGL